MSRYDVAFLACRLLALYFLYQTIVAIPQALMYAPFIYGGLGQQGVSGYLLAAAAPAGSGLCAMLTWFLAPSITRRILPPADPDQPPVRATPAALLSVGFALIGAMVIFDGVSNLNHQIWPIIFGDTSEHLFAMSPNAGLISGVVEILLGFFLLVRARGIAALVLRLRRTHAHHG